MEVRPHAQPAVCLILIAAIAPPETGARADTPRSPAIILRATRLTVRALCERLTALTGARHTASAEVADLHVSLSVRALPAGVVRDRIAEVMNLTWVEEEGEDPRSLPSYRLLRSARNSARERDIVAAEEGAYRSQLGKLLEAAREGDEALKRLAESDDWVAETLSQPGGREALALVASLSPSQLERVLSGDGVRFGPGGRSEDLSDLGSRYLEVAVSRVSWLARWSTQPGFRVTAAGIGRSFSGLDSYITVDLGVSIDNGIGGHTTGLLIRPPADFREWWDTDEMRKSRERNDPTVEVEATIEARRLDDLLDRASAVLGFNYVAESYREDPTFARRVPARRAPLSAILDSLLWSHQTWWRRGSVYLFQRKRWWEDRQTEIPDALWEQIKARMKANPQTLEDWSELAVLTEKQWVWLQSFREMGTEYEWLPELALYRALLPGQRAAAFGKGLSAGSVTGSASRAIVAWLRKRVETEDLGRGNIQDVVIQLRLSDTGTEFVGIAVLEDGSLAPAVRRLVPLLPASVVKRRKPSTSSPPPHPIILNATR